MFILNFKGNVNLKIVDTFSSSSTVAEPSKNENSKIPVGLANPRGTFCFENSVIQLMNTVDDFRQEILKCDAVEKPASAELQQVFQGIDDRNTTSLEALLKIFKLHDRQHDAHEFMSELVTRLSTESAKLDQRIKEIFTMNPDSTSFFFEQPYIVAFAEQHRTLKESYNDFEDQLILRRNLMFYVYRVGAKGEKCEDVVTFPLQMKLQKNFFLKAVVAQSGSSCLGHYICFVCMQRMWYRCSDESIKKVDESEVLATSGKSGWKVLLFNLLSSFVLRAFQHHIKTYKKKQSRLWNWKSHFNFCSVNFIYSTRFSSQ